MKSALIDHSNLPLVYANAAGDKVVFAEVMAEADGFHLWQLEGPNGKVSDKVVEKNVAKLTQQTIPSANQFTQKDDQRLVWQGPRRYFWLTKTADITDTDGLYATNQSHSKTQIRISGERARALLMRGVQVDISATAMPVGSAYMTHINHIGITLMRLPDAEQQAVFELWVMRGFAVSLFEFLKHTAVTLGHI